MLTRTCHSAYLGLGRQRPQRKTIEAIEQLRIPAIVNSDSTRW
jgi:hypothetical protein